MDCVGYAEMALKGSQKEVDRRGEAVYNLGIYAFLQ